MGTERKSNKFAFFVALISLFALVAWIISTSVLILMWNKNKWEVKEVQIEPTVIEKINDKNIIDKNIIEREDSINNWKDI